MTIRRSLFTVAAGLMSSAVLAACGSDDSGSASTSSPATAAQPASAEFAAPAAAAVKAVAGGASLLDVRRLDEWEAGHARGAQLFTLSRLEAGELPDIAEGAKVFVYCRTGRRAAIAVKILKAAGFTDVTNIGGLADWKAAGGPLAG